MPFQYTPVQIARFWSKVNTTAECWTWHGARNIQGYGQFSVEGRMRLAHRVSEEMARGALPSGLCVLHHCDNPPCVRPDHLFRGTRADNMRDMVAKGRYYGWTTPDRVPHGDNHYSRRSPEAMSRGEHHYGAKLTEADVQSIRLRYAKGGITQKTLAAEYGVGRVAILKVIHRYNWKHI